MLVDKLNQVKATSKEIGDYLAQAEFTEQTIDAIRMQFYPNAKRAANLFFCTSELSGIDPMYQYSLDFFINLFKKAIDDTPKTSSTTKEGKKPQLLIFFEGLQKHIQELNDNFTYLLYCNICTSLFERHKLLFSFLICVRTIEEKERLDPMEWRFFMIGKAEGLEEDNDTGEK